MARIMLNKLNQSITLNILLETQCGLREDGGTIDIELSLYQIHDKCQEQNMPLFAVFINFTQA